MSGTGLHTRYMGGYQLDMETRRYLGWMGMAADVKGEDTLKLLNQKCIFFS